MSFWQFFKQGIWDMLLCAIAGTALAYTVCSGFYASVFLREMPFVIAAIALVMAVGLYCVSYNARSAAIGSGAIVVLFVAAVIVCVRMSTSSSLFADEQGNYALACILVLLPQVIVFLLTRKRMTCAVLLVVGVFAAAIIEYLYAYGDVLPLVLFGLASIALTIYRTYQRSLLDSESDAMAFNAVTIGGVVFAAFSMLLGFGVFMLVVMPLNPPATEIKLITEHYRIQYEHVRGIGDTETVQSEDQFSNNLSDDEQMGNRELNEIESQQDQNAIDGEEDDSGTQGTSGNAQGFLSEQVLWWVLIVLIALVVLCVLAVAIKRFLRHRWYTAVLRQGPDEQVGELYRFFLSRFKKMGIAQPRGQTLAEFVRNNEMAFSLFESTAPAGDFMSLTKAYAHVTYGGEPASTDEVEAYHAYYGSFYKNARRYVGRFKYLLKFFRL